MNQIFLIVTIFITLANYAYADSYDIKKNYLRTGISPNGKYLVRGIRDIKCNGSIINTYVYDVEQDAYAFNGRFRLNWEFGEIFVSNSGSRIIVVDGLHTVGLGDKVVAVLNGKGKILKQWSLENFYDQNNLKTLTRTISMRSWHSKVDWLNPDTIVFMPPFSERSINLPAYLLSIKNLNFNSYRFAK